MKDKVFVVRIGDLLQESGRTDTMHFDHKFSDQLPEVDKEGISGSIHFQSLNPESVYARLENVHCVLHATCDNCECSFERIIDTPEYTSRFVISEEIKQIEEDQTDESIFLISSRDESIHIEDMLVQSIRLQDPFVIRCPKCEKKLDTHIDEDEEIEYLEGVGNVRFH